MSKLLLYAMLLISCASTVIYAEADKAYVFEEVNGYDWIQFTGHQKSVMAELIGKTLKLDLDQKERIVRALDIFYKPYAKSAKRININSDANEALSLPCIAVIELGVIQEAKNEPEN